MNFESVESVMKRLGVLSGLVASRSNSPQRWLKQASDHAVTIAGDSRKSRDTANVLQGLKTAVDLVAQLQASASFMKKAPGIGNSLQSPATLRPRRR